MDDSIGLHYHVSAGTVGCLPEGNEVFLDLDDALEYFRKECADYRDAGQEVEEVPVLTVDVRRNRDACLAHAAIAPINYLQVVRCGEWENCPMYLESAEEAFDGSLE